MELAALLKHERAVPRYTSYPTAAQFNAGIGAAEHGAWLAELPAGEAAGLYLHVPYCRSLCWYCACNTRVARHERQLESYAALLKREIGQVAAAIGRRQRIASVQWGGGTPTELGGQRLIEAMDLLRAKFDIAADAEISVETDPRTFDGQTAADLARAGVNRVSLGVQDFDPAVQAAINRHQSVEQTRATMDWLRAVGIERLNVDLVYGLPRQTLGSLDATLDRVLALAPARLAVFGYAHVPWMKRHQKLIDEASLPGTAERFAMAQLVERRLVRAGYIAIGLDHFARSDDRLAEAAGAGRLRRNFQGYTDVPGRWVIGLGASSISQLPGGMAQNHAALPDYNKAIVAGQLATARGVKIGPVDWRVGEIIERLMCDFAVDLAEIAARHNVPASIFLRELAALRHLQQDGLVTVDGWRIAVPAQARVGVRLVCAVFDRYLQPGGQRHSRAV